MSAIIKACSISNNVKNTGKECDTAMLAPAMLVAIDPSVTFTLTDMLNPVPWLVGLIQQRLAFPLFGISAPINNLNNNAEKDILVTLDDGLQVFMRYGIYNRLAGTTKGGLCYAESLQSFLNSGLNIIEIDKQGQMLARKNFDGTFSGLISSFMYSPTPIQADLKSTPYLNQFQWSYDPQELVNNGIIFKGAQALLSMTGLIDAMITKTADATTTVLTIGVVTECAGRDLVTKFGANIAKAAAFLVYDKADSTQAPVTVVAALSGSSITLTGVFTTGHTYHVVGTSPAAWAALSPTVPGYDASETGGGGVDIIIP